MSIKGQGVQPIYDGPGNLVGVMAPNLKKYIFTPVTAARSADVPGRLLGGHTFTRSIYSFGVAAAQYPGRFVHVAALRRKFIVRNPLTNTTTMQVAPSSLTNFNANPPGSGWIDLAPGQELMEAFTSRQWFVRPKAMPVTALTSVGTVATATVAAHGMVTGDFVEIVGSTPTGYNSGTAGKPVTVVDANTFTYALASAQAVNTVLPTASQLSQSVEVETEVAI